MKYRVLALLFLVLGSSALSACGDAGDHFGEFRRTGARIVPVNTVQLSVPKFNGQPGVYSVAITAFEASGSSIPIPNSFTHPIVLSSTGPCAATFATSLLPNSFAQTVNVNNTTTLVTAQINCSPLTITAQDVDMPHPVSISL